MAYKITLEEALELVDFRRTFDGVWCVKTVKGNCDSVRGSCEIVVGDCGTVEGNCGIVEGKVLETINGQKWDYVETPKGKLQRLIKETGNLELLEAFNQLEDN